MEKIFCIGMNKTGTTSLYSLFTAEGYKVAPQKCFESNLNSYIYQNYSTFYKMIVSEFSESVFFQDVPFSLPIFYEYLDSQFPDAKFILTVRDSSDEWYESLISFYKLFSPKHFSNPKKIDWFYEGWLFSYLTKILGAPEDDPYSEEHLKMAYELHNRKTKIYFQGRPEKLLVLNLKEGNALEKLEEFLSVKFKTREMPHENKSR